MRVWRLCKAKFARTALSGIGARLYGGRWNSKGALAVYTSETPSLALIELLVQVDANDLPPRMSLIPVDVPDDLPATEWNERVLPRDWKAVPHSPSTRRLGDRWLASRSTAVLAVPSAIVPQERNFILNPAHPDFGRIRMGKPLPFRIDLRLSD